jgi:hypothetical protein
LPTEKRLKESEFLVLGRLEEGDHGSPLENEAIVIDKGRYKASEGLKCAAGKSRYLVRKIIYMDSRYILRVCDKYLAVLSTSMSDASYLSRGVMAVCLEKMPPKVFVGISAGPI